MNRLSAVEPGSVHDLIAARAHVLPALYDAAAAGLPTLADGGYLGAGIDVHVDIPALAGGRRQPAPSEPERGPACSDSSCP
jgi:hypothetical protein